MNNVNAKRIISFALAVVMTVMTTISVSAASNELPYGTSMTYDFLQLPQFKITIFLTNIITNFYKNIVLLNY